jgi:hypothetical protein
MGMSVRAIQIGWQGPGGQYRLSPINDLTATSPTPEGFLMKLRMLAAAAALTTVMFAGSAFADGRIAAALDAPVAAKTKVVAGGAVFVCEGAECVSTQAPSRALTAVACKALAKEVGRVAAFGGETKSLDADDLTRCNASAKGGSALASAK